MSSFSWKSAVKEAPYLKIFSTADIRKPYNLKHKRCSLWQKGKQRCPWSLVQAVGSPFHRAVNQRNSFVQVAVKSRLNATANAESSVAPTSARNAASQDPKRGLSMGTVIVTYKVFPEDIVQNFDNLKKQIETYKQRNKRTPKPDPGWKAFT